MNRGSQNKSSAGATQGVLLTEIINRIVVARHRVAVFEGNEPDEGKLRSETIAGLQRFVDDDHHGTADLREQFWNELEGDVDALHFRSDRVVKSIAGVRRQAFTVIDGGKNDD